MTTSERAAVNLSELEQLARATKTITGSVWWTKDTLLDAVKVDCMADQDAEFMSACSPEVISALCAAVRAAQDAAEALEHSYDATEWPANGTSRQEIAAAALRRALEPFEAQQIADQQEPPPC